MSAWDRGAQRTRRAAVLGLTGWLALPAAGAAQDLGRVELWGFLGGLTVHQQLGSVSNLFFTTTGEAGNVSFGKWLGLRASYRVSPYFAVEGGFAQGDNAYTLSVDDKDLDTVALGEQFDVTQRTFNANAVFQYVTESGVVPYATVGVTRLEQDPVGRSGVEKVDDIGYNLGGGVKYVFASPEWLGVRFDVRRHFVSEGIAFPEGAEAPNTTEFTFGVILHFLP